jgi:sulfite exporter TauE/SafE
MNTLTFTMALLMGFTGSLHCAGMCGPIVWIMPFQVFRGWKKALALGMYHAGRISTYAFLGIVLHSFRNLFQPRVQQYISIGLGGALLLLGLLSFLPNNAVSLKLPWAEYVKKQLGAFMGKPGLGALGMAGILNGLLPCGLVYMALSASLAATTTTHAAALMYTFGLGTVPMLAGITLLKNRLGFLRASHFKKLVPITVFFF